MRVQLLILVCLFLASCNKGRVKREKVIKTKIAYHTNLVPGEKRLIFDLNSRIVNRSICILPYKAPDSSEYLFYLNGQGNDICVFSIDSARLVKTIRLLPEGPNGVGGLVRGFEVINFDTIYITSAFIRRLFLVNSDARVISTIDYSEFKQEHLIVDAVSRTNMRMGFKNGEIYLPFYPPYDEGNYQSVKPEDMRCVAKIDVKKKIANTLNIGFPPDYWETDYYPPFFGFFVYKDNFYLNYMCDDRIIISPDTKNWKTYNIPSRYVNVKKLVRKQNGWGVNPNYFCFVFDPYRDVFYRFVMHEQSHIKDRTRTELIQYPQKFSVIILDKDMNIIGETLFPIDTYDMHGYFIHKDGLYLSLSNPYNPAYNVDKLEFQQFNLIENEK